MMGRRGLVRINVKRFRGGLVFKAHRSLYHSTLGSRVIKKKKKRRLVLAHDRFWSSMRPDEDAFPT